MKGYKVVNYNKWKSIKDIFSTIKEAKKARDEWRFCNDAIIEYFNSGHKHILNTISKK